MAFVATAKPEQSKIFYTQTLGLRLLEDSPFAIVCDAGGTMLRIQRVEKVVVAEYTTLGWDVPDIRAAIVDLTDHGVTFERFSERFSFMQQDELGIWTTPDGSQVAWFKDPDGNTLSLTQFASAK